ncbi:MAG: GAF domain-containing protein, partial [Bacteroidetes bacterium]
FRVRCRNVYGLVSQEDAYIFVVLPPWYRTGYAYFAYLVLLGLVVWGVVKANIARIQRKNIKLENIVTERTAELNQQKEEILAFNSQLSEQKESITKQADELRKLNEAILEQSTQIQRQKEEVERTYENIKVLAGMGRKITATLRFEDISMVVYSSVMVLMDAATFGIGIYDAKNHRLEFSGTVENGEILPTFYDYLDSEQRLSTICFLKSKEIVIQDIYRDYNKYLEGTPLPKVGRLPQSVIYVPLEVKDKIIGVCTVQSFKKDAYSRYELDFLRNLAAYISIAVANAKSYEIINAKNTQITDSLRYAQTIQQVILPHETAIKASFQDFFTVYKPRDIVSGDFYWFAKTKNKIILAVVDCTGHGVPGAFMSLIGNNLLDKIVKVLQIDEPKQILNMMSDELNEFIGQKSTNEDGMDVSLCAFEYLGDDSVRMQYAGAKRPAFIYHLQSQSLESLKGQNRSIGVRKKTSFKYEQTEHILKKNDLVYLFSDGFID